VPDDHLSQLLENVMSYIEQGIGKRFGSLTTFLLQLNPTCFLENKTKKSSGKMISFEKLIFDVCLDGKYNMFATAHHPCKYLSNPKTRNMRKLIDKTFRYLFLRKFRINSSRT